MLSQLVKADVIRIHEDAEDWQDAVLLGCQPLIDKGAIEPGYVQAIYKSTESLGPYYVLAPGIAMPHARPEDGVNAIAMSFCVIRNGVNFGSEANDPVRLLTTLAATDSNGHIELMTKLAELLDNNDDVQAIMDAPDVAAIEAIIAKY
jgi:PTS system ascorbate-specific IIA component